MKEGKAVDLELFFAALADRTRLRLLNLMQDGEVCVCFFAETLGTNNPKISRHLAYLKRAGLVTGRRDGKWMHYRICKPREPALATVLARIFEVFTIDSQMFADRERLVDICCPSPKLVGIERREPEVER